MEEVNLIKTLNSRSLVKSSELIKLDWLPGFTCQRKQRVDKKIAEWANLFFLAEKKLGRGSSRCRAPKLMSFYVVFLKIFHCCFYSIMQEPTAKLKSTAWTDSNKREKQISNFPVSWANKEKHKSETEKMFSGRRNSSREFYFALISKA